MCNVNLFEDHVYFTCIQANVTWTHKCNVVLLIPIWISKNRLLTFKKQIIKFLSYGHRWFQTKNNLNLFKEVVISLEKNLWPSLSVYACVYTTIFRRQPCYIFEARGRRSTSPQWGNIRHFSILRSVEKRKKRKKTLISCLLSRNANQAISRKKNAEHFCLSWTYCATKQEFPW